MGSTVPAHTRIGRFAARLGFEGVTELVRRSAADPEWFYPAAFEDLDLPWLVPFSCVRADGAHPAETRWFPDGGANVSWLTCDRWADSKQVALVWEDEDGSRRELSRRQLADMVAQVAAGLRCLGIGIGDVVALYLPMVPEMVVSLLATARLGAIAAPAFSGYGAAALAERLSLGHAKVLISADRRRRKGRSLEMGAIALEAARSVEPSPQIVMVRKTGPLPPGAVDFADLLEGPPDTALAAFDADTPFLLAFTSGSTGRPKGAVHSHGGSPYADALMFAYHFNLAAGDRLCWVTDPGWIMGPVTTVATLALGATLVLFDGAPDWPNPDCLWRLVEEHGLTHLGLAPTLVRMLAAAGDAWVDGHRMESLRILGSTGEPWTAQAWSWLDRHVGRGRAPIINLSGGTESGGILAGNPAQPVPDGLFPGPVVGMPADVVDERGRPVIDVPGELVLTRSWPAMTRGLWDDPKGHLAMYWSDFPGMWRHGDRAIRHSDGSWEILGRSDDVIKVAGKRVGPVEYEDAACQADGVRAAAAIGVAHPVKGQVAVLAVIADGPVNPADQVRRCVVERLGKALAPAAVLVVPALPLTRSGKVHRRALRAWLSGEDPGDLSTLDNPEVEMSIVAARTRLARRDDGAPTPKSGLS